MLKGTCGVLLLICLMGCATFDYRPLETTEKNFRKQSRVFLDDYKFMGASEGKKCLDQLQACSPKGELDLKVFRIQVKNSTYVITDAVKDFAYLIAAEVSLKQGYSRFIVTSSHENITYDNPTQEYRTLGTIINNTYVGNTVGSPARAGATSGYSINILCFNDYGQIENGVFVQDESKTVKPFEALYMSAEEASRLKGLMATYNKGSFFTSIGNSDFVVDAWKSYYEAEKIKEAILKKYKLSAENYDYRVERRADLAKEPTIQEKYRVINSNTN